jgi:hypothetical protein
VHGAGACCSLSAGRALPQARWRGATLAAAPSDGEAAAADPAHSGSHAGPLAEPEAGDATPRPSQLLAAAASAGGGGGRRAAAELPEDAVMGLEQFCKAAQMLACRKFAGVGGGLPRAGDARG